MPIKAKESREVIFMMTDANWSLGAKTVLPASADWSGGAEVGLSVDPDRSGAEVDSFWSLTRP